MMREKIILIVMVFVFFGIQGQTFKKIGTDTNSVLPEYNVRKVQTFFYDSEEINYVTLKNDIDSFFDLHFESLKVEEFVNYVWFVYKKDVANDNFIDANQFYSDHIEDVLAMILYSHTGDVKQIALLENGESVKVFFNGIEE